MVESTSRLECEAAMPSPQRSAPPNPRLAEPIWSMRKSGRRIDCELQAHGDAGYDCRICDEDGWAEVALADNVALVLGGNSEALRIGRAGLHCDADRVDPRPELETGKLLFVDLFHPD